MWPYFLEQASQISRTMHRKGIIWANQVYSMPNTVCRKVMKLDSRSGATKDMAAITSEMPPAMIKTGVKMSLSLDCFCCIITSLSTAKLYVQRNFPPPGPQGLPGSGKIRLPPARPAVGARRGRYTTVGVCGERCAYRPGTGR